MRVDPAPSPVQAARPSGPGGAHSDYCTRLTGESTKVKERLGIVGTGAVAAGLARVAAEHGEVVVWARSAESHSRAQEALGDDPEITTDLEELRSCTLVIEAVVE